MTKGRHAAETTGSFYRDLVMMVVGILLVGGAVFLLLYLFAGDPAPVAGDTSAATTTVTSPSTAPSTSAPPPTPSSTSAPSTTAGTEVAGTTVPVRPPSEVRVVVLNSIGVAGAAGRKTQQLADAGYQTQQADDYEPEQNPSRIWYREGFAAEANGLLEFLPGATVEPIPDPDLQTGADVILVLGTGYTE